MSSVHSFLCGRWETCLFKTVLLKYPKWTSSSVDPNKAQWHNVTQHKTTCCVAKCNFPSKPSFHWINLQKFQHRRLFCCQFTVLNHSMRRLSSWPVNHILCLTMFWQVVAHADVVRVHGCKQAAHCSYTTTGSVNIKLKSQSFPKMNQSECSYRPCLWTQSGSRQQWTFITT